ncbi:hypothetical protein GQ53DRAFT_74487 [Thozetella sp. PMI_491]|nr:hypothetical protein GQ53DRAFT_74487 [Thozetella sp. PMI_491]
MPNDRRSGSWSPESWAKLPGPYPLGASPRTGTGQPTSPGERRAGFWELSSHLAISFWGVTNRRLGVACRALLPQLTPHASRQRWAGKGGKGGKGREREGGVLGKGPLPLETLESDPGMLIPIVSQSLLAWGLLSLLATTTPPTEMALITWHPESFYPARLLILAHFSASSCGWMQARLRDALHTAGCGLRAAGCLTTEATRSCAKRAASPFSRAPCPMAGAALVSQNVQNLPAPPGLEVWRCTHGPSRSAHRTGRSQQPAV